MGKITRALTRAKWGEGALWLLFATSFLGAMTDGGDTLATLAGVAALAAIGVRATRFQTSPASSDRA